MFDMKNLDPAKIIRCLCLFSAAAATAFLLYSIFVRNTYPPPDEEIAKKIHFVSACGLLTLSALLISVVTGKKMNFRLNVLDGLVLAFALYILLNSFITDSPARISVAILMLLPVFYFDIRLITAANKKFTRYLVAMLLMAGLGQIYIGAKQLLGLAPSGNAIFNLTGSFYNPGPYAGFLSIIFTLALHEALSLYPDIVNKFRIAGDCRKRAKIMVNIEVCIFLMAIPAGVAILILMPSTMSRMAWLAMAAGATIVLSARFKYAAKVSDFIKRRKSASSLAIALTAILAAVAVFNAYNMKRDSADGRLLIWKISSRIMFHNPVTGTGIGKFSAVYGEEQAGYFAAKERSRSEIMVADCPTMAFNDYLQIGAALGIIGLALFLLIIVSAFCGYIRSKDKGMMYALVPLLIFALASYPLMLVNFQIIFVIIIAVAGSNIQSKGTIKANAWITITIITCLLMLCCYEYSAARKLEPEYKEWSSAKRIYSMNNYKGAAKMFKKLYPVFSEYPDLLFDYGRSLNQIGSYAESNHILGQAAEMIGDPMVYNIMGNNYKSLGEILVAEGYYQKAHSIIPNRIYPLYLLATLYFDAGQDEKAIVMAERVLDFQEKVSSEATEQMKRNIRKRLEEINSYSLNFSTL